MIDEQKMREVAVAAAAGNDIAYDILCEQLGNGVVIIDLLDELATLRQERTAWRVTEETAEAAVKQARIDALEEAQKAVDDETLTDPQDASDDAYNAAVYDCVQAIRSLKEHA